MVEGNNELLKTTLFDVKNYPDNSMASVEYKRLLSSSSENASLSQVTEIPTTKLTDNKTSQRKHSNQWTSIELSWSKQTIVVFVIWYIFSFLTLFFNKYILMDERNDPVVLGESNGVPIRS